MYQLTSNFYAFPYLGIYFILLYLTLLEFYSNKKNKNKSAIIITAYFFLFIFFGLRGFVYSDTFSYYIFYQNVPTLFDKKLYWFLFESFYSNKEIGFNLYSILIKTLSDNYHFFLAVSTFVDLILIILFFNHYCRKYHILALMFFFVFSGVILEMNLMRNIKAILIFMLSLRYIQEKRIVPFLSCVFIAILFHISAIIYIPMYFLLRFKLSDKVILICFVFGVFLFFSQLEYLKPLIIWFVSLFESRLQQMVIDYFTNPLFSQPRTLTIGLLERMCSFILLLYYRKKILNDNPSLNVFYNSFIIYILIYFYFSELSILIERLPVLFIYSYWVLFPALFYYLRKVQTRQYFMAIFIVYSVFRLTMDNNNILARYDNLLFGIQDYKSRYTIIQKVGSGLLEQ